MSIQTIRQTLPTASDDDVRTLAYLHGYPAAVACVGLTPDQCTVCGLFAVQTHGRTVAGRDARIVMNSAN